MTETTQTSLLLTFYGDDFSGSTDVLEALSMGGVPAVLFLRPPSVSDLGEFAHCRAVGVAGISRSQTPAWMQEHLPPVFQALRALGAPLCHYKVCSTFDSSPEYGSIGRAVELGMAVFRTDCVPVVVGAPVLRRYVLFGNLFAEGDGQTHRIDRHPTMSKHPVTPMGEADLRLHFQRQSAMRTSLVDVLCLRSGGGRERLLELQESGSQAVFFDTLDDQTLEQTGRALWETRTAEPGFVAGSSGVEYALLACWRRLGLISPEPLTAVTAGVDRLLVVSGSCSPRTAEQIRWALRTGFFGIAVDPVGLMSGEAEYERILNNAMLILNSGGSPLIYSAAGPGDVIGKAEAGEMGQRIGIRLGELTGELVRRGGVRRMVVAGGDTSGHAGRALGIRALTLVKPFAPGSPLCRIRSEDSRVDGAEILLKGGQVGGINLFGDVRAGYIESPVIYSSHH